MLLRLLPLSLLLLSGALVADEASVAPKLEIPLAGSTNVEISRVMMVTPTGLRVIRAGTSEAADLPWERIDLEEMAQRFPELDRIRMESILVAEPGLVRALETRNYYEDFLMGDALERVDRRFRLDANASSGFRFFRADYRLFENPLPETREPLLHGGGNLPIGKIGEAFRESFEGTLDRLLYDMSDYRSSSSREVLRQLVDYPVLFQNLRYAFIGLQEAYPEDAWIGKALNALEEAAVDPNNARRQQEVLASFLEEVRKQADIDPEMLDYD